MNTVYESRFYFFWCIIGLTIMITRFIINQIEQNEGDDWIFLTGLFIFSISMCTSIIRERQTIRFAKQNSTEVK